MTQQNKKLDDIESLDISDDFFGQSYSKTAKAFESRNKLMHYTSMYYKNSYFENLTKLDLNTSKSYNNTMKEIPFKQFSEIIGRNKVYFIPISHSAPHEDKSMYAYLQTLFNQVEFVFLDDESFRDLVRVTKIFKDSSFLLIQPYLGLYIQGYLSEKGLLSIYFNKMICEKLTSGDNPNNEEMYYTDDPILIQQFRSHNGNQKKNESQLNKSTARICEKTYIQYYFDHSKNYLKNSYTNSNDFIKFNITLNFTSTENSIFAFIDFGNKLDFNGWSVMCDSKTYFQNGIHYLNAETIQKFRKSNDFISFILYYDNTPHSSKLLQAFTKAYETSLKFANHSNYRFGIININTNGIPSDDIGSDYPYHSLIVVKPKTPLVQGCYKQKSKVFKGIDEIENCIFVNPETFQYSSSFVSYYSMHEKSRDKENFIFVETYYY